MDNLRILHGNYLRMTRHLLAKTPKLKVREGTAKRKKRGNRAPSRRHRDLGPRRRGKYLLGWLRLAAGLTRAWRLGRFLDEPVDAGPGPGGVRVPARDALLRRKGGDVVVEEGGVVTCTVAAPGRRSPADGRAMPQPPAAGALVNSCRGSLEGLDDGKAPLIEEVTG